MPELPDVETFKRYVDSTALHEKATAVSADAGILGDASAQGLGRALHGRELAETRRHGKWLFVRASGNGWLVLHFGMTGRPVYYRGPDDEPDHARLRLTLANGYHLALDCQRKFGTVDLTDDPADFAADRELGPDALAIGREEFAARLGRRGMVKSALMRQQTVAGLGNIYADEILFQAGIDPRTPVRTLDEAARRLLSRKMRHVLRTAIDRQADPARLPESWLLPHRDDGATCPRCGGRIRKVSVSGRATYFCANHQHRP